MKRFIALDIPNAGDLVRHLTAADKLVYALYAHNRERQRLVRHLAVALIAFHDARRILVRQR